MNTTEKKIEIGQRIRNRREELGLSQDELAKLIGYTSRSTINKIEMGKIDIAQSKIEKFSRALDIPPMVLMGWGNNYDIEDDGTPPDLSNLVLSDNRVMFRSHYVTDIIRVAYSLDEENLKLLWNYANKLKKQK